MTRTLLLKAKDGLAPHRTRSHGAQATQHAASHALRDSLRTNIYIPRTTSTIKRIEGIYKAYRRRIEGSYKAYIRP